MPDPHRLVAQLQQALGLSVVCGTIALNVNEGRLQSIDVRTHARVTPIDKPEKLSDD